MLILLPLQVFNFAFVATLGFCTDRKFQVTHFVLLLFCCSVCSKVKGFSFSLIRAPFAYVLSNSITQFIQHFGNKLVEKSRENVASSKPKKSCLSKFLRQLLRVILKKQRENVLFFKPYLA